MQKVANFGFVWLMGVVFKLLFGFVPQMQWDIVDSSLILYNVINISSSLYSLSLSLLSLTFLDECSVIVFVLWWVCFSVICLTKNCWNLLYQNVQTRVSFCNLKFSSVLYSVLLSENVQPITTTTATFICPPCVVFFVKLLDT